MNKPARDLCPKPYSPPPTPLVPHAPPIFPASVYRCRDFDETERLLGRELDGYVYQRDGHPNADMLAGRCQELHQADWTVVTSSGMSAMAAAILSRASHGDHILASDQLYGQSLRLILHESQRMGITATVVDATDLTATRAALRPETRLMIIETITNPLLRVVDISALAEMAKQVEAELVVDNTFATPLACQPLTWGADMVVESVSKLMNGHSDVMMGMLAGRFRHGQDEALRAASENRVRDVISVWGLASSPFDCWLAARGLSTLHLRFQQACGTAQQLADLLSRRAEVREVYYPGLTVHPDYEIARRQFGENSGWMVTFNLKGGQKAAQRFMSAAQDIPFCPSLGEVDTTLSHPASTSHRRLSAEEQQSLGIQGGTIRLSVGTESAQHVLRSVEDALDQL